MEGPDRPAHRLPDGPDLRLAPFALGCWAASLTALFTGRGVALALGVAGALGAALAVMRDRFSGLRRVRDSGAGVWRWIVAGAFLGVLCGAAATGARLAARDAAEVVALVDRRASMTVVLIVRDDPRRSPEVVGRPASWVVAADLEQAGDLRTEVGVLVLASGDGWAGLLPGQRVRVPARFGPSRGGDLRAAVLSTERPPELLGRSSWAQRAAGGLRAGLQRACAPLDAATGGLLPGLVVGDTSRLEPAVEQSFRDTGMTHLTAVSGSNVAIVTGAVLLLARRTRAGPGLTAVVCAVSVVGFVILARPSPSVLRAAVMGGIALLALASGRSRAALPALSAGAAVLLMADPELAADAGFALSVLATAGLLLLAPPMRDALRRRGVPGGAAEALAVPAAAQLACAPVVAGISGTLSLVAVPANLVAVPAIAPTTVTGVAAALLSPVWPPGAEFAAWLGSWPAWWLVTVARVGAEVPAGVLPWPGGPPGALLLAGLTVLLLVGFRRPAVRRLAAVVALAGVLGALPVRVLTGGWPPDGWLVVACDVGQGDATVLNAGGGAAVVVDAGPKPRDVDRCLRELDVDEVPLLLVSHFHVDHIGGLDGVLAGRRVAAVVTTPWPEPAAGRAGVARAAAAHRVPVSDAPESGGWTVGDVRLEVLPAPPARGTRSDPNNNSLMLVATVRGVRVLLTGDAETERQQALLEAGVDLSADVLKVAHHGSAFQEPSFLDAVAPRIALVSVGEDNDYGHPSASVLARLSGRGARVQRTDVSGDLAVVLAAASFPSFSRRARWSDGGRPPVRTCDDSEVVSQVPSPVLTPVVLVLGDEELLVARAIADAAAQARAADPAAEVREVETGTMLVGELAELLSPSLFGGVRVVVLRAAQDAKKDVSAVLLDYAKSPDPDVTLVVAHAGGAKNKALADSLTKAGASVVPAAKLTKHRDRVDFVTGEVRRLGGRCAPDAAETLIEAVGNDLRELAAACAQLMADTGGRIDQATVARYYRGKAEVSGFAVADAAVAGDVPAALEALRWARHSGVDPVPIADALADGVRTIARVASAGRGNAYQLASTLGMPAWKIEKAQRQARGWTPDALVLAMRAAADCNAAVKGGEEDRDYALERTIVAFAQAKQAGGGR